MSAAAVEDLEDDAAEAGPPRSPQQRRSAPGVDSSTTPVAVCTTDADGPEHDAAANDSAQSPASGPLFTSAEVPTTTDGSTTTTVGIRPAESVQPAGVSNDRAASDGRAALSDSRAALSDGPVVVSDGRAALSDGRAALSDSRAALSDGRAALSDSRAALSDGPVVVSDGRVALSDGRAALSDGPAVVVDVAECSGAPDRPAALSTSQSAAHRGRSTVSCDAKLVDQAAPGSAVSGPFAGYLTMLRTGVGEAIRVRAVRNGVLLGALLSGITAFDEYFALLAESVGVSTAVVPLLVGVTVLGSLIGSISAGRTEAMAARTMAVAVGVGGVLFAGGALIAGLAIRWPSAVYVLAGIGFTAIGVSYGILYNASIVAGARLQDAIEGPARATVTSVCGLASEVVALAVFGFAAAATAWLSMPATVALLGATILPIALVTPSWLPRRRASAD
ncbi:hypothetical protein OHA42_05615 [Nocardia sp. NBC_01009]|nr:hypothetical protein OHA42_05615 [Nocardia sp. NBC_01009]